MSSENQQLLSSSQSAEYKANSGTPRITKPSDNFISVELPTATGCDNNTSEGRNVGEECGAEEIQDDDSELSEGEDLRDDLEEIFNLDFDHQGSFYHSEAHTLAPNPCLMVDGVGQIGLPLSERDAQALIQGSSQAPFGHGTELVIDPKVRHTWEIEPKRIQFLNPAWATFIQQTVITSVWKALGVAPTASLPECKLYKLLLYETGSHFLPHQDTEKSPGMFATVVIVLPSLFTGGEVHVSHASKKQVIDLAPNSLLATSVIAWYTDVFHEVKPITSGYRLALSYNLIHTAPGIPQPRVPDESGALNQLRKILQKWQDERYTETPEDDRIAYILEHQYSPSNLRNGLNALKGEDAQLVAHVKKAAGEFGFRVFLGNLRYTQTGSADGDCGYGYYKRSRCFYDEDSDDGDAAGMYMSEVNDTSIHVDNIVDAEGDLMQGASLAISEESFIPKDPFEDADPDGKSYQGYQGNYPGDLDQWYSRSVLIIATEYSALDADQSTGPHYHLEKLKKYANLNQPLPENRKAAGRVMRSIARNTYDINLDTVKYMLNLAIQWKDSTMWKDLANKASSTSSSLYLTELVQAMPIFGFEVVKPHLEELLRKQPRLQQKYGIIKQLSSIAMVGAASGAYPGMDAWCRERYTSSIASLAYLAEADIPTLLDIGAERTASYLHEKILPLFAQKPDFHFIVAFAKSLHERRNQFPDAGVTSSGERSRFDQLLGECLNISLKLCNTTVAQPHYDGYGGLGAQTNLYSAKLDRIMKTVELCHFVGRCDCILTLFSLILKTEGSKPPNKVTQFYAPLVSRLRAFTDQANVSMFSPPYNVLVKIVVELYLHYVLGTPGMKTDMQARKIGCSCNDCLVVNEFIRDSNLTSQLFRMVQKRRLHVEFQLNNASDLVTYQTIRIGSPHGVQVQKTPSLIASQQWLYRVQAAQQFLAGIGNNSELSALMGTRFKDMALALRGTRLYALDQTHHTIFSDLTNTQTSASGPSTSSAALTPANTAAGQKRKVSETSASTRVVSLGVVDLTGEN